jgi:hypothetical protein
MNLGCEKKEMNGIEDGGYNLPLANFWKEESIKLERAFNFAKEELKEK